jgi:hypothetical protein
MALTGATEEAEMATASYGYTKTLGAISMEEAERRVTEALKSEGFGVLTEIDVQATLKKKLDVQIKPYKILLRRQSTVGGASRAPCCRGSRLIHHVG